MTTPRAEAVPHLPQPIPLGRSILWTPVAPSPPPEASAAYAIFLEQPVLPAVQGHVESLKDRGLIGFLVGDLFECRDTNARYVVVDSTIRLLQPLSSHNARSLVHRSWKRIQQELRNTKGQLLGWYHSHPPMGIAMAPSDVMTHLLYFLQPWQIAVVAGVGPGGPVGGVFRLTKDEAWPRIPVPFYELLAGDPTAAGKQSLMPWTNYRTADPAMSHGRQAGSAAVPSKGERRTLEITGPRGPEGVPMVGPSAPSTRAAQPTAERPTRSVPTPPPVPSEQQAPTEPPTLEILHGSEEVVIVGPPATAEAPQAPQAPAPPPPTRRPSVPAASAPTPPAPSAPPPRRPSLAGLPLLDEERGKAKPAPRQSPRTPPRPAPPRPVARPVEPMWVRALKVAVQAAAQAASWLAPMVNRGLIAMAPLVTVQTPGGRRPRWRRVGLAGVAVVVVAWLVGALTSSSGGPAERTPDLARLAQLGDSLAQVVGHYSKRALLFDRKQAGCAVLAGGLVAVDELWIAYNVEKRSLASGPDGTRAGQDESLYAQVDSVERQFERSRCPRP